MHVSCQNCESKLEWFESQMTNKSTFQFVVLIEEHYTHFKHIWIAYVVYIVHGHCLIASYTVKDVYEQS